MMRLVRAVPLVVALSLLTSTAGAYDERPLTIDADSFVRANDHMVVFTGTVIAQQSTWRLQADRMEAYLDAKGDYVLRVTATGNVRVATSDCRQGKAERIEYFVQDERMALIGKARLWWDHAWGDQRVISREDIVIRLPRTSSGSSDCAVDLKRLQSYGSQ